MEHAGVGGGQVKTSALQRSSHVIQHHSAAADVKQQKAWAGCRARQTWGRWRVSAVLHCHSAVVSVGVVCVRYVCVLCPPLGTLRHPPLCIAPELVQGQPYNHSAHLFV